MSRGESEAGEREGTEHVLTPVTETAKSANKDSDTSEAKNGVGDGASEAKNGVRDGATNGTTSGTAPAKGLDFENPPPPAFSNPSPTPPTAPVKAPVKDKDPACNACGTPFPRALVLTFASTRGAAPIERIGPYHYDVGVGLYCRCGMTYYVPLLKAGEVSHHMSQVLPEPPAQPA